MSKRSKYCEFDKNTRLKISERDNNRCVYCKNNWLLGVAHVFVSRAQGGKGCEENGVILCQSCHIILDQGSDTKKRININNYCCDYLYNEYGEIDKKNLIYNKLR